MTSIRKQVSMAAVSACLAAAAAMPMAAHATVISGTSSAYGESVALTTSIAGIAGASINSGPLPTASGTAPLPYTDSHTVASVLVAILADSLSTGILTASANSTVTGTPGVVSTTGTATVDNLGLALTGLFSLSATVVQSQAGISGGFGSLVANGSTTITGLTLNGSSVSVGSTPNFVLLNNPVLGVEIVLNEQISGGNGSSSASMTVNAIDITLTNALLGLDLLNGHIIISQSVASETAQANSVPEPGTFGVLGGILGMMTLVKKRK